MFVLDKCQLHAFSVHVPVHGVRNSAGAPHIELDTSLADAIERKAGSTLDIEARVTGHPTPVCTWYHGDLELVNVNSVTVKSITEGTHLTVRDVTGSDGGKYRLMAENKVGSDEAEIDVVVKERPSQPLNLQVKEVNKNDITITWSDPESDGGAKISEFIIEKKDTNKAKFTTAGTVDADVHLLKVRQTFASNVSGPCFKTCSYSLL